MNFATCQQFIIKGGGSEEFLGRGTERESVFGNRV